ncbi:MAG TPA: MFS transporter [Chloroflexota bacterium]
MKPIRLRKPFYGWYIVAVAFISLFLQATGGGFTFSIFLPTMNEDLGWSRSTIVAANSIASLTAAAIGPLLGRLVDRRGPRIVLTLCILTFGIAQLASGFVQQPWQFYLAYGLIGGASRPGLQSVVPGAMIAHWFSRRRSIAYSMASLGPPIANVLIPPAVAALVAFAGWRAGWDGLGLFTLAVGLAPALLIVRTRPEDRGLRPDGDAAAPPNVERGRTTVGATPNTDEGWTAREALHSRAFWMVATGMSFILLAPNTSVVFLYSYLNSKGLGPAAAAAAVAGVSGMQVISRVVFWLPMIARLKSVRRIVLLWGSLLLTSTLILALADSPAWAYVAAGVLGVGLGGSLVLLLQIWPEYFGRRAIGTIIGSAQALQGVSSATVPFLLAALLDRTGSFTLLYLIVAVFVLTGLALHVIVGKPTRQGLEP